MSIYGAVDRADGPWFLTLPTPEAAKMAARRFMVPWFQCRREKERRLPMNRRAAVPGRSEPGLSPGFRDLPERVPV